MRSMTEFREAATKVSNWNRWGADDEFGTLNFIDTGVVRASADAVRTGESISLATPIDAGGIWPAQSFRRNPIHLMSIDGGDANLSIEGLAGWGSPEAAAFGERWGSNLLRFADDFIIMPLQCASHWDALSHVYYDELLYNGYPASLVSSFGAARNSIARVAERGVVGRGVFLDVARFRGVDALPLGAAINADELDAVAAAQDVELRSGDIVLVRTGWWNHPSRTSEPEVWRASSPGLDWQCAGWLHEHEIAAVAADNIAVETSASAFDDVRLPLHLLGIRDMGLTLGELWDLEALSSACAGDGTYDFQLHATPLAVTGAVGAPVSPIAVR